VELNLQKIIFGVDLTSIPHWVTISYEMSKDSLQVQMT